MYAGKNLSWSSLTRIVDRCGGNRRVCARPCGNHFRIMAFAQIAYRESLGDIDACFAAQAAKL